MGIFRKAGKRFEEAKQEFTSAKEIDYLCRACEEAVTQEYEECPYCGEAAIEAVE